MPVYSVAGLSEDCYVLKKSARSLVWHTRTFCLTDKQRSLVRSSVETKSSQERGSGVGGNFSGSNQVRRVSTVLQHISSWAKKSMKHADHDKVIEVVQAGEGHTDQCRTDSLAVALVHVASLLTISRASNFGGSISLSCASPDFSEQRMQFCIYWSDLQDGRLHLWHTTK